MQFFDRAGLNISYASVCWHPGARNDFEVGAQTSQAWRSCGCSNYGTK
jgi:hypothetical protein